MVWLNICLGDKHIGNLALLNKKASMACGIKNLSVMLFELDADALVPFRSRTNSFTHLAEYPMTDYDVSLLFDAETQWADMQRILSGIHNELFHGAAFVDEYHGKQIPEGKKSVTIRLTIGSTEKTLTSPRSRPAPLPAVKKLVKNLGAELRGK